MDARYEQLRQGGHIVSQGVLIVAGVRAGGHREILAVTVAAMESEATHHQVFRDLQARGLSGVRLVTSDDHPGLKAAIDRHCQGASWQRSRPTLLGISSRWSVLGGVRNGRPTCANSVPRRHEHRR